MKPIDEETEKILEELEESSKRIDKELNKYKRGNLILNAIAGVITFLLVGAIVYGIFFK